MLGITTKLEVNITPKEANVSPTQVWDFVRRHGCSLIVDPRLFHIYFLDKVKRGINNKLGILLDFPKGETNGVNKFTNLPEEVVDANFFDILLNSSPLASDLKKDLANTVNTIKGMLNQNADIRLTLRKESDIENTLKIVGGFPLSMIRDSQHLTSEVDHDSLIAQIRKYSGLPIKLSGNITYNTIKSTYKLLGSKGKYDVTFDQAKKIVQSIESAENNNGDGDFKQSRLAIKEEIEALIDSNKLLLCESMGVETTTNMYSNDDALIVESDSNLDNEILVELEDEILYINVKTKKPQKAK